MHDLWSQMQGIVRKQTGRRLVGTKGGLYEFSEAELQVPHGSVEGAVHDLCHWVVASDSERRQPNMGLSQDWTHPNFTRMVRCEELAWSLELYLFRDPSAAKMSRLLTPEARASGSGGYTGNYSNSGYDRNTVGLGNPIPLPQREEEPEEYEDVVIEVMPSMGTDPWRKPVKQTVRRPVERTDKQSVPGPHTAWAVLMADEEELPLTEAAKAEMAVAASTLTRGEHRPDGSAELRREALRAAERVGLQVEELRSIADQLQLASDRMEDPLTRRVRRQYREEFQTHSDALNVLANMLARRNS